MDHEDATSYCGNTIGKELSLSMKEELKGLSWQVPRVSQYNLSEDNGLRETNILTSGGSYWTSSSNKRNRQLTISAHSGDFSISIADLEGVLCVSK